MCCLLSLLLFSLHFGQLPSSSSIFISCNFFASTYAPLPSHTFCYPSVEITKKILPCLFHNNLALDMAGIQVCALEKTNNVDLSCLKSLNSVWLQTEIVFKVCGNDFSNSSEGCSRKEKVIAICISVSELLVYLVALVYLYRSKKVFPQVKMIWLLGIIQAISRIIITTKSKD